MSNVEGFAREELHPDENASAPKSFLDREIDSRAIHRIGVWLLALVLIAVGIVFSVNRRVVLVDPYDDTEIELVNLTWLGPGLLCVGLLILAAVLIAEAYRPVAKRSDGN